MQQAFIIMSLLYCHCEECSLRRGNLSFKDCRALRSSSMARNDRIRLPRADKNIASRNDEHETVMSSYFFGNEGIALFLSNISVIRLIIQL